MNPWWIWPCVRLAAMVTIVMATWWLSAYWLHLWWINRRTPRYTIGKEGGGG